VLLLLRTLQIVLGPTESTYRKLTDRKSSSGSNNYSSTVAPPYKPAHSSTPGTHNTSTRNGTTAGVAGYSDHAQQRQQQQQYGVNSDSNVVGPGSADVAALTSLERGVTVVIGSQADLAGTVRCTLHTTTSSY
jgi:hypothetical protein